jgi:hypothetical protein
VSAPQGGTVEASHPAQERPRVYLKSLTLKGFKSFAQPTTFAFEQGVTCVVCPDCAFTFDADHVDSDGGGYTCPLCHPEPARNGGPT